MIVLVLHLNLISVNFKHTPNLICSLFLSLQGIYAASKLTRKQQDHLAVLKEEGMFCCGGTLIPKDHFFMELFCPAKCDLCSTCGTKKCSTPLFCTGQVPSCFATTVEPKMFSQFATSRSNNFSPCILSVKTAGQTVWKSALVVQRESLWMDKFHYSETVNNYSTHLSELLN